MTNSELIAQIEAAMAKATPGEWRRASTRFNAIAVGPFSLTTEDIIANTTEKRDARYIAAVNPAVMAQVVAYARELEQQQAKDVQIKARLCMESNRLHDRLRAADRRIAELESRAVRLPEALVPSSHKSGEPFMRPEPYGNYLNRDDVIRALNVSGIPVKVEG